MKEAVKSQMNSFEAMFDLELAGFFLKRLIYTFLPLAFFLFVASRFNNPFFRNTIATIGVFWAYLVLLISTGCVCRAVFIKYVRKSPLDMKACHGFSITYAPAYLLVPCVIIILGAIIKTSAFLLLLTGNIKFAGEVILGIIIIPLVLISITSLLVFAMAFYLSPAIIAVEEEGFTWVFRRVFSILNYIPIRFIVYLITGLFSTFIVMLAFTGIFAAALPGLAGIAAGALKLKAVELGIAVPGSFIVNTEILTGPVPFTYHIFALFAYLSAAVLLSLILFIPGVYACSSAVHIYRLIRAAEIDAIDSGSEPLIRVKNDVSEIIPDKMICPHCRESVKGGLFFCTQCGKKLQPDSSDSKI
ncbi:MAG: hypothetical protein LWY06_19585 [Firmicutes bacterium]|nr:hypothetical protein [Bacillota bacterium]